MLYRIAEKSMMKDVHGALGTLVFLGLMLLPKIFYLMTMHRALTRSDPRSRNMNPGLVWLSMIPLFAMAWDFVVVVATSATMEKEYTRRGRPLVSAYPGLGSGITFCILSLVLWIPFINVFVAPVCLVFWIVYWVKIARLSAGLR